MYDSIKNAYGLLRTTDYARGLASDKLVKSAAPNAEDLCAGKLDFASALRDVQRKQHRGQDLDGGQIDDLLRKNTTSSPLKTSTRQASVDLAMAQQLNSLMLKLMGHVIKMDKLPIDNFRVLQ